MTVLLAQPNLSLTAQSHTLVVKGDVHVNAAAEMAAAGVKWLQTTALTGVAFDFADVTKASSAAISVLFEWLRACHARGIVIQSITLSSPLERLASLAELDALIKSPNAET